MLNSSNIGNVSDFDTKTQKPKKIKSISYRKYGYFFVTPFILFFLMFSLYPTLYTFIISFTDRSGLDPNVFGNFVWFDSYKSVVGDKFFWRSILTTLKIWGVNV